MTDEADRKTLQTLLPLAQQARRAVVEWVRLSGLPALNDDLLAVIEQQAFNVAQRVASLHNPDGGRWGENDR